MPRFAILFAALAFAGPARAEEISVFAAASLTEPLEAIAKAYQAATGHSLALNLGASNDLARQIIAGAPADVFVSADVRQMDSVEQAGAVLASERVELLSNLLVVIVPAASTLAVAGAGDLAAVEHLALADPAAVPAGVYAKTWLESAGAWAAVKDHVVPMLNVRAALAAVESEAAEAGVVYKTDAAISRKVRVAYEVPREQGPKIVYVAAPLRSSKRAAAARELVRYLRGPEAGRVFERYGFVLLTR